MPMYWKDKAKDAMGAPPVFEPDPVPPSKPIQTSEHESIDIQEDCKLHWDLQIIDVLITTRRKSDIIKFSLKELIGIRIRSLASCKGCGCDCFKITMYTPYGSESIYPVNGQKDKLLDNFELLKVEW